MDTILNFFKENPMVTYSILIFIVCLFIGYFGNKYVEKQKEIRQMEKKQENQTSEYAELDAQSSDDSTSVDSSSTLSDGNIIDENVIMNNNDPTPVDKNLQPFDGVITNDDNINNTF